MKTETRAKHTPGPWEKTTGFVRAKNGVIAAYVGTRESLLRWAENPASQTIEANGRLIAAAPRMYNFILDAARNGNQDAQNIIAAVEGEQ